MGAIFCLYSTQDGEPRFIAGTATSPEAALKQHLTAALENEEQSDLYHWMRDVLRAGFLVDAYVVQEEVARDELEMFELYWARQFPDLLNRLPSEARAKKASPAAASISAAIRARIRQEPGS